MRHRGSGGDDVVDHDASRRPRTSGRARNTEPASRSRRVRPVCGPVAAAAIEQPTRRHAELGSDVAGQELALVEAPFAAPRGTRGRPRDHVDPRVVAVFDDLVHDETGEVPADLPPVPVLQPEHHVACPTGERHGGMDTVGLRSWRAADEGESTGGAHGRTRGITSGATSHQEHEFIMTRGVQSSRAPVAVRNVRGSRCDVGTVPPCTASSRSTDRRAHRPLHRRARAVRRRASRCSSTPTSAPHRGTSSTPGSASSPVGPSARSSSSPASSSWRCGSPSRSRPGLGTVLNAFEIGLVVGVVAPDHPRAGGAGPAGRR